MSKEELPDFNKLVPYGIRDIHDTYRASFDGDLKLYISNGYIKVRNKYGYSDFVWNWIFVKPTMSWW